VGGDLRARHVVGGYLHPDGKTALVKVFISRVRLVTETRFLRIDMSPRPPLVIGR
jgi:hypothetical protein